MLYSNTVAVFKSLMHFELIFIYDVYKIQIHFLHVGRQFSQYH
jgi:hypothetical protein